MADFPPFMNAYGSIKKILTKITEARDTTEIHTRLFVD